MSERTIILNRENYEVLRKLVEKLRSSGKLRAPHFARLARELAEARVVESSDIPDDIVTLYSRVRWTALDTNREGEGILVFPAEVRNLEDRISVLSPFGLALIGEQEGTVITYEAPGGTYQVRIDRVEHLQPVT